MAHHKSLHHKKKESFTKKAFKQIGTITHEIGSGLKEGYKVVKPAVKRVGEFSRKTVEGLEQGIPISTYQERMDRARNEIYILTQRGQIINILYLSQKYNLPTRIISELIKDVNTMSSPEEVAEEEFEEERFIGEPPPIRRPPMPRRITRPRIIRPIKQPRPILDDPFDLLTPSRKNVKKLNSYADALDLI